MPEAYEGGELNGSWQVERSGGLLPPLHGVRKQINGERGWTQLGPIPVLPFDVVGLELRYRPPLNSLIDVLRPEGPGAYSGSTTIGGKHVGTFTMVRSPRTR